MGGIFRKPKAPPRNMELERELAASRAAEEKAARDAETAARTYSEKKAKGIFSLPLYPEMKKENVTKICGKIKTILNSLKS